MGALRWRESLQSRGPRQRGASLSAEGPPWMASVRCPRSAGTGPPPRPLEEELEEEPSPVPATGPSSPLQPCACRWAVCSPWAGVWALEQTSVWRGARRPRGPLRLSWALAGRLQVSAAPMNGRDGRLCLVGRVGGDLGSDAARLQRRCAEGAVPGALSCRGRSHRSARRPGVLGPQRTQGRPGSAPRQASSAVTSIAWEPRPPCAVVRMSCLGTEACGDRKGTAC